MMASLMICISALYLDGAISGMMTINKLIRPHQNDASILAVEKIRAKVAKRHWLGVDRNTPYLLLSLFLSSCSQSLS